MKTSNSGRILMTPGVTVAPFSEAMPAHPQNGDEVIAVNVGSSTYTLTGTISGGDVEIAAGGSVILVYAGQFGWEVTWNSAGGGSVTYPTTVAHGGTGADLSGLDAGQLIAFDGPAFAGVDASIVAVGPGTDVATNTLTLSATDSGANTSNVSVGIELPSAGVQGDFVARIGTNRSMVLTTGASQTVLTISAPPGTEASGPPGNIGTISLHGFRGNGNAVDGGISTIDFVTDETVGIGGGGSAGSAGPLFVTSSVVAVGVDPDSGVFGYPLAQLHVRGGSSPGPQGVGLFSQSLAEISLLAQTSATDGSNANPTVAVRTNTGQTNPLQTWEDENGIPFASVQISEVSQYTFSSASAGPLTGTLFSIQDAGGVFVSGTDVLLGISVVDPGGEGLPVQDAINVSTGGFSLFKVDNAGNLTTDAIAGGGNGIFGGNLVASGTGTTATASIGSGTDGTVALVADAPGLAGNGFTVEVVVAAGANDNASAAFVLQALTVTLGKTAGVLDPAKNTATIIAGLINTAAGGVTATASGTGADPLTGAEGPTTFAGGAESLTLAGGLSANANIYLTNLPGSDPGIPGALYQTAGAVMVSL